MTIRAKTSGEPRVIDLDGPDGNAFALMGLAKQTGKMLGWNYDEVNNMLIEMQSGDYENLVKVFDDYFGDIYILERSEEEY